MRTQILMKSPLLSVEEAYNMFLQEEAQKENLKADKGEGEPIALYSKGFGNKDGEHSLECTVCGGKKHFADKCWKVIGYPRWHPMYKRQLKEKETGRNWTVKKRGECCNPDSTSGTTSQVASWNFKDWKGRIQL
ncbi:Benzoyl-CoA reductase subunit D [Bienertia sinuspersici]